MISDRRPAALAPSSVVIMYRPAEWRPRFLEFLAQELPRQYTALAPDRFKSFWKD
jgi:hypothetical protein